MAKYGIVQNYHLIFSQAYTNYAVGRGGGVNGRHTLLKNVDFHTGSLKINIIKVLIWEGGGSHSVYAFDNVDNSG